MRGYSPAKELLQVLRNRYIHLDKKKTGRRIVNILLSLIIAVIVFFIIKETIAIVSLRMKMNAIKSNISNTKSVIDSLSKEENRLKYDTFYIEKIAREKFGMIKRGEKTYIFVNSKKRNFIQRIIENIKNH